MSWLFLLGGMLCWGLIVLFFAVSVCWVVAAQARRRGYSLLLWLAAGLLACNPLFLLVVLATIPHRSRLEKRRRFLEQLDARLAELPEPVAVAVEEETPPAPQGSIGDRPTVPPEARVSRQRSLGDQTTNLPQRSLGDEETRL
jgi:hypothetical protein